MKRYCEEEDSKCLSIVFVLSFEKNLVPFELWRLIVLGRAEECLSPSSDMLSWDDEEIERFTVLRATGPYGSLKFSAFRGILPLSATVSVGTSKSCGSKSCEGPDCWAD